MKQEIIVTRIFDAPVEAVWKCWTEPEFLMQWWGPDRFTSPKADINFQENKFSVVCMRAPVEFGGQDFYNVWLFKKIVPYERIEYIQNLSDENGNLIDPVTMNLPSDFPKDTETTVTFKNLGKDKTEITFREVSDFGQMFEQAKMGLGQCLGKMQAIFSEE